MSKIYLINVGANSAHVQKARSPFFIDDNGHFEFVGFVDRGCHQTFPLRLRRFVRRLWWQHGHLDPDWERLTYGDCCQNPRAKALLHVETGDILLFWGMLWRMPDRNSDVWESRERGWYLFGALRVGHILATGQTLRALPRPDANRARQNAHTVGWNVERRRQVRVFIGDPNHSTQFERAVDLEIYRRGSLLATTVRDKAGRRIQWKRAPKWNSVTRACRAVLDLSEPDDFARAKLLGNAIKKRNPDFDLLAGVCPRCGRSG
jgi:hypothetical protein